jgi:hypothetical protein
MQIPIFIIRQNNLETTLEYFILATSLICQVVLNLGPVTCKEII